MKIDVSVGEVVDKITILKIKQEKIKNKAKLQHIETELLLLSDALKEGAVEVPKEYIEQLKEVNEKLWDTEDVIRLKEKNKDFDETFVQHARLDAKLNDQRFLIKNKINNHCDSLVKEQKSYEGLYTAD